MDDQDPPVGPPQPPSTPGPPPPPPPTPPPPPGPPAPPPQPPTAEFPPSTERVFGAPPVDSTMLPGDVPVAVAPRASRTITLSIIFAIILAAGGAVVAVRALRSGTPDLDSLAPADSAAYFKASVHPSIDQQRNLRALFDRVPGGRDSANSSVNALLRRIFREQNVDYDKEVKAWLGDQVAVSVSVPSTAAQEPDVVALVHVTDANAARATLTKLAKGDSESAFLVDGGVAYLSKSQSLIDGFRQRAKSAPLSEVAAFKAAHDRDGDGLVFGYFDGASLARFFPTGQTGAQNFGNLKGSLSLRAESEGIVLTAHSSAAQTQTTKPGRPALVESSPADLLGALTVFDLGGAFQQLSRIPGALAFGGGPVNAIDHALSDALGLDLADLLPWMHGEVSVVVGGFSAPPIPDLGVLIQPTDQTALARTLGKLRTGLGSAAKPVTGGLDITGPNGITIALRTGRDRVVLASTPAYATRLLGASSTALGDDTVYKRVLGAGSDRVSFQTFVRIDRIRSIIETFLAGEARTNYERDVKPWLAAFEAFAMRASTTSSGEGEFKIVLSVVPG